MNAVNALAEEITPALAEKYLKMSNGNRTLRWQKVKALVGAICRGEWRVTHQGIAFDSNGYLRDGHHRLTAIASSGCTVKVVVFRGLNPADFDAVDQGIPRSVADVMGVDKRIAEPLRYATSLTFRANLPTVPQIAAVAETGLYDVLDDLIKFCGRSKKGVSSAPVKLAAAIRVLAGADKNYVFLQYRALCGSDYDTMSSASRALARVWSNAAHTAGGTYARLNLARALAAFDPTKKDNKLNLLRPGSEERAVDFVRLVLDRRLSPADTAHQTPKFSGFAEAPLSAEGFDCLDQLCNEAQ
jgi:hypothetical protein